MAGNFNIQVNLNSLDTRLQQIARSLSNFDVPLRQSSVYLEGSISRRFSQAGGSRGRWKSLSPATIKRHPNRAGGIPLSDTGRLRQSVTSRAVKQYQPKRLRYTIGTNVKYAKVHNFGNGTIPKREFMYTDARDDQQINRVFKEYIRGLM